MVLVARVAFGVAAQEQEPSTDHAVGFYDARLQRVVLVSGAGDPKDGDRDKVWSWSGTRWEPGRSLDRQDESMLVLLTRLVAGRPSSQAGQGRPAHRGR